MGGGGTVILRLFVVPIFFRGLGGTCSLAPPGSAPGAHQRSLYSRMAEVCIRLFKYRYLLRTFPWILLVSNIDQFYPRHVIIMLMAFLCTTGYLTHDT